MGTGIKPVPKILPVFLGTFMIEVTKLNGARILINPHLLEVVEETPDTVLTLTTGKKIIVKESRQEIKNLVKSYRKEIFADSLEE